MSRARNGSHDTLEVQGNPILEIEAPERFEIGGASVRCSALQNQKVNAPTCVELDANALAELGAEDIKRDVKYPYSPI